MSLSFLALGDSYTIGEGVAEHERWPNQLASRLRKEGISLAAPRIVAQTGWTTEELLAAIAGNGISGRFDLVTLLAGVNDQFRGHGVDRYRASFERLLQVALAFAKLPSRLIVLSIPDWGITPFAEGRDRPAVSREIDIFNTVARELAMQGGARFLDITQLSRQAATDPSLLVTDQLHPSGSMYDMWVEALVPIVKGALTAP